MTDPGSLKFIAPAVLPFAAAASARAQAGAGVDQQLIAADRSYYKAMADAALTDVLYQLDC